jgi:hypothetical protein
MKQVLVALATVVGLGIQSANAELHLGGGLEYFDWREDTSPQVKETGPVAAFHAAWIQDKSSGVLFGAKGRVWTGSVDYEGASLVTNQPLSGTTDYFGLGGEGQLRFRTAVRGNHLDFLLGLGWEYWLRQLTRSQSEEYTLLAARAGLETSPGEKAAGLLAGIAVKYPFYVYENGNFKDIGARNNPILKPKGTASATAHLGYRLDNKWQIVGYYESVWLRASDPVYVDFPSGSALPAGFYYQPESHMNVFGLRLEYQLR